MFCWGRDKRKLAKGVRKSVKPGKQAKVTKGRSFKCDLTETETLLLDFSEEEMKGTRCVVMDSVGTVKGKTGSAAVFYCNDLNVYNSDLVEEEEIGYRSLWGKDMGEWTRGVSVSPRLDPLERVISPGVETFKSSSVSDSDSDSGFVNKSYPLIENGNVGIAGHPPSPSTPITTPTTPTTPTSKSPLIPELETLEEIVDNWNSMSTTDTDVELDDNSNNNINRNNKSSSSCRHCRCYCEDIVTSLGGIRGQRGTDHIISQLALIEQFSSELTEVEDENKSHLLNPRYSTKDRNGGCWKGGFSGTEVASQGSQVGLIHDGENAAKEKIDEIGILAKEIAALKEDRDRLIHRTQISDQQSAALCFVAQYTERQREFTAELLKRECRQRDLELERLGGEVTALSKELGVQLECHREEVAELIKSHEQQLNSVIREHEDQLLKHRKKEESLQEIRRQHLIEIQTLKESHRLELDESNQRHRQLLEEHTKQSPHDLLLKEVASLQVVVEMRNGELRECRKELIGYQTTKEDLSSCQEQVKTRQAKIEDLEAQLEKGRRERRHMAEQGREDEERILGLESQNSELTRVIDRLKWELQNNCRELDLRGGHGECHNESHKEMLDDVKLAN